MHVFRIIPLTQTQMARCITVLSIPNEKINRCQNSMHKMQLEVLKYSLASANNTDSGVCDDRNLEYPVQHLTICKSFRASAVPVGLSKSNQGSTFNNVEQLGVEKEFS